MSLAMAILCLLGVAGILILHSLAVDEADATLRARFDARGAEGEPARLLMREAGYRV